MFLKGHRLNENFTLFKITDNGVAKTLWSRCCISIKKYISLSDCRKRITAATQNVQKSGFTNTRCAYDG